MAAPREMCFHANVNGETIACPYVFPVEISMGCLITGFVISSLILPRIFENIDDVEEFDRWVAHVTKSVPDNIFIGGDIALDQECAEGIERTLRGLINSRRHGTVAERISITVRDLSIATATHNMVPSDENYLLLPYSYTFMTPSVMRNLADETVYRYLRLLYDRRSRVRIVNYGMGPGKRGLGVASSSALPTTVLGSQEVEGLVGILWDYGRTVDLRSRFRRFRKDYELHGPASFVNASCRKCANCAFEQRGPRHIVVVFNGKTILPFAEYLCSYGDGHEDLSCPICEKPCD